MKSKKGGMGCTSIHQGPRRKWWRWGTAACSPPPPQCSHRPSSSQKPTGFGDEGGLVPSELVQLGQSQASSSALHRERHDPERNGGWPEGQR